MSLHPAAGGGFERTRQPGGDDRDAHRVGTVLVPKSHKMGSVGSAWWKRAITLTDDRLRLLAVEGQTETVFV